MVRIHHLTQEGAAGMLYDFQLIFRNMSSVEMKRFEQKQLWSLWKVQLRKYTEMVGTWIMKLPSSLTFGESHTVKHSNRRTSLIRVKVQNRGKNMAWTGAGKKSEQVQIVADLRCQGKFFPTRSWVFCGVGDCKRVGTPAHAVTLFTVSDQLVMSAGGWCSMPSLSLPCLPFLLCPSRKGVMGRQQVR